jgi:protein TonB
MPRDLFGDVQHPTVRVGSRSRYTVPLSLAAHAAAVLAIAGATILGPVVLPGLASSAVEYYVVTIPPPPPPPAPRPPNSTPPTAPANPNAAPAEAPEGIAPEPDVPFDSVPATDLGSGILPGVADIDTVVGEPPPPARPVVQEPVRPGGHVRPPTKVHDVAPLYPSIALAARVQGPVLLEAIIDTEGRVQSVRVLRSPPMLDAAAVDAVRQWRYTPTLLNGTPVPVIMTVTVMFQLR